MELFQLTINPAVAVIIRNKLSELVESPSIDLEAEINTLWQEAGQSPCPIEDMMMMLEDV